MKKLFVFLFLAVLVFGCISQEVIYYNSTPTLQWDAVTENVLPEHTITYGVYLWDTAGGDICTQPIENLTFFGMTSATYGAGLPLRAQARFTIGVWVE